MFLVVISGCTREHPSDKPPIHLNPNMDDQPKYKAQAESKFFEDDATMRTPVSGTVAQGELRDDDIYYKGKNIDGSYVLKAPLSINKETLLRGQERFDIYCSPCHSRLGDGRGIMLEKGYVPPPTFHSDRLRNLPDGEIFEVISNGVRNMPSYRHQINVHDRWTIVLYMRALQRSQNASINDIPVELRETVK
ncbi:MAG: cytochrome c [candidate division Zixibacteria bacterium]|nr:cytochrome c [candidate division Zixibacteria bacterium]